jgi:gamma-glutamylcyclotransferase (GGCT)/AIG2-like uncharacterized protein YtfP
MQQEIQLFAYGSFTSGMVHFEKLAQYVVDSRPAAVLGQVYRLSVGYPVVLRNAEKPMVMVPGQLLTVRAPDLVFKILDEFQGFSPLVPEKSLFFKETVAVQTEQGPVEAMMYVMNPSKLPKSAQLIEDGNWLASMQASSPLTESLTERQANYVKRLSQVTGREILPIDMELYRELMKLELVVDKGRRLALSKLGQEVARYLPPL